MSDEKKVSQSNKGAKGPGASKKGPGAPTDNGGGKAKSKAGKGKSKADAKKAGGKDPSKQPDTASKTAPVAAVVSNEETVNESKPAPEADSISKSSEAEQVDAAPEAEKVPVESSIPADESSSKTTEASEPALKDEVAPVSDSGSAPPEAAAPAASETAAAEPAAPAAPAVTAAPATPAATSSEQQTNFDDDEIRSLLVPVPAMKRLMAAILTFGCFFTLIWINIHGPIVALADGVHTIEIPEPGSYVVLFKGKTEDAFGWSTKGGRFRNSLRIDVKPMFAEQFVRKLPKFKDISGSDFFSVAEYEFASPGEYMLYATWRSEVDKCQGKIVIEKDPVERFFIKWALGIVGTIAFFFMIGIPLTTRSAQATLPGKP